MRSSCSSTAPAVLLCALVSLGRPAPASAELVNYAEGAPISCTNCCGQGSCDLINDGDHYTYAQTIGAKADNTATVDLTWMSYDGVIEELYWKTTIVIAWGGEIARLQVQEEGGGWTTIAQHTGYGGGTVALDPPRRILRARIWANSGSHWLFGTVYRFFELEAWGPPLNACCFADGSCQVLDEAACWDAEGIPWGPSIGCDPNPCPQPPACCFPDDTCELLPVGDCYDAGGSFSVPGYECEPNPCTMMGACCLNDDTCEEMELADCVASPEANGWIAEASCVTDPCPEEDHFEGEQFWIGTDGDPVNTATGNFHHEETDLLLASRVRPVVLSRYYNSLDTGAGPLGTGWRHSYQIALTAGLPDDQVAVRRADGRTDYWTHVGNGYVPSDVDVHDTLVENTDETWTLTRTNYDAYAFDASGRLLSITDKNGNVTALGYEHPTHPDLVTAVTDAAGRSLVLTYDDAGLLQSISDWSGRSVHYAYTDGELTEVTDVLGNPIRYVYDENGYLAEIHDQRELEDGSGTPVPTLKNAYDENGRVLEQWDARGNRTAFEYGIRGEADTRMTREVTTEGDLEAHLLEITHEHEKLYKRHLTHLDPTGQPVLYGYDGRFNRNRIVDRNGNETSFEYDERGNVTSATEADDPDDPYDGGTTIVAYPDPDNPEHPPCPHVPLSKTDALGYLTEWEYDDQCNVSLERRYLDLDMIEYVEKSWTYNDFGQRTSETDERGNTRYWIYDADGLLIEEIDREGNHTWHGYDDLWRRIWMTDGRGSGPEDPAYTTHFFYDNADRLIRTEGPATPDAPDGITRWFGYDEIGNRKWVTDGRGTGPEDPDHTTRYFYDNRSNLIRIEGPEGRTTWYVYDELNRQVRMYDANNNPEDPESVYTWYVYDDGDRLIETHAPEGNVWTYEYDAQGNLVREEDSGGIWLEHEYDALNRRVLTGDALEHQTHRVYDVLGRVMLQIDAEGNETQYTYDALGRLTCVLDAEGGWTEYFYDAAGNLVRIEDARDETVSIRDYDANNRLIYAEDGNGNFYTYEYDEVGNQTAVVDARGERTELDYDAENRLIHVDYPGEAWAQYEYDNNGNRVAVHEPEGSSTFVYDNLNRLTASTDRFGKTVGYAYDAVGNRTGLTYPGDDVVPARTVTYGYDDANRLTTITDWADRTTEYTYLCCNRIETVTYPNGLVETWGYDPAGRLVSKVTGDPGGAPLLELTWERDGVGNPTSVTENGTIQPTLEQLVTEYEYDADNRLVESSQGTYEYDANGNLISRTVNDVTTTFTYDAEDRLISQVTGGSSVQHVYDAHSYRIARIDNGVATRYVLDRGRGMSHVLCETDEAGTITAYYIHGPMLVARIGADATQRYYHTNDIGNVMALTDENQVITDRYGYTPFGLLGSQEGTTPNPFTYVGGLGVMAEADGLYFMRARFYDPNLGRFLGKDPFQGPRSDPKTLHSYVYASNTPAGRVDPRGLWLDPEGLVTMFDRVGRYVGLPALRTWLSESAKAVIGVPRWCDNPPYVRAPQVDAALGKAYASTALGVLGEVWGAIKFYQWVTEHFVDPLGRLASFKYVSRLSQMVKEGRSSLEQTLESEMTRQGAASPAVGFAWDVAQDASELGLSFEDTFHMAYRRFWGRD